jgi:hypothetical protein
MIIPRKFKVLAGNSSTAFDALKESYEKYTWYASRYAKTKKQIEDYGLPLLVTGHINHPIDYIMDYLRDFTGIIKDMRRQPQKVKDANMALNQYLLDLIIKPYVNDGTHLIIMTTHLASYLKPKDFAEFYFPCFRDTLKLIVELGFKVSIALEGCWNPTMTCCRSCRIMREI